MPLQKRKKKSKPSSDKSVKQVVTQVVKVNIGDTKPKKKRKRKSGGGVARAAVPSPMLAQVPQQFIYPPQSFPQEAPMAPQRPQPAAPAGVQVPDPFPVSALNRVIGSVPRSTLAVQPEVQRPTLLRSTSEQIRVPSGFVGQPPPIPKDTPEPKISAPPFAPEPFGIGPSLSAPPMPRDAPMVSVGRDSGKDTLVEPPMMMPNPDDPKPPVGRGRSSDKLVDFDPVAKAEKALRGREATRRSRSRSKSKDKMDPPKLKPGPKPGSKNKVRQVPGQQGIGKYIPGQAEDLGQPTF